MPSLFTKDSVYKKQARSIAILWTLLIFLGCFLPAREIPKVDVPLADKWVHFLLFGGFTFLWLLARPTRSLAGYLTILALGIALGVLVEVLQGMLAFLGRASEWLDAVADSIGALLGVALFAVLAAIAERRSRAVV
jgi:VanZ family protein